jgi:hypothetical protein
MWLRGFQSGCIVVVTTDGKQPASSDFLRLASWARDTRCLVPNSQRALLKTQEIQYYGHGLHVFGNRTALEMS